MASRKKDAGLSRRMLLKGGAAAAATGAILRGVDAVAEENRKTTVPVQGPDKVPVELQINGTRQKLEVETRTTLLQALRLDVGLTGAKPVCDRGQCGACTVLMDGQTVCSCTVLAVEATGSEIVTCEGLGTPDNMHPVQEAFVQADALQCGFCTPGMVVSCAWAVQQHGKELSEEQARDATCGNLCRCGTYPHVLSAALNAAKGGAR